MKSFKTYLIIICSFLSVFLLLYFSLALYIAQHAEKDTKVKSDSILVLGARSYIGGKYNPCLFSRVQHAVALFKDGYASKIVVSGGNDVEDGVNEADTMQKIAIAMRINKKDILEEKSATSTYENFTFSQKILKQNHLKSVIVVTEPFHIARASLVAKKLGYDYTVSPAENSPCWQPQKYFSHYFLKEPFALMGYKVEGRL